MRSAAAVDRRQRRRNLLSPWLGGLVVMLVLPSVAIAQPGRGTRARRRVPVGEVTGLEMAIDGSLQATPGSTVRWFVTLYEVLRRRDLRPAANAHLRVTASFAPGEPIQIVGTDAQGHAAIEIPLPTTLGSAPHIRVEAESPRHVRRVFSVSLNTTPAHAVELYLDQERAPPGATVALVGRVTSQATGRPVAEEDVTVRLRDGSAVGAPVETTTDQRGVFEVRALPLPTGDPRALTITASVRHGRARRTLNLENDVSPALWVETHAPDLAAPGELVTVEVSVRSIAGEPVPDARLTWQQQSDDALTVVTDAEGRGEITWQAPATITERMRVAHPTLVVSDPGRGTVQRRIPVRVSRVPVLVAWAVDGGALVPGSSGRVFARVTEPAGAPYRGSVTLEMAALGGAITSTSDADGVAVFEGPVATRAASPGACGGTTASEAVLVIGQHRERLCLPLDPDATLRVTDVQLNTDRVEVSFTRAATVRRSPVEVTALVSRAGRWTPVARAYASRDEGVAQLALPDEARGELWVRARPILDGGVAVRGGSQLVYRGRASEAGARLTLQAGESGAEVDGPEAATFAIYAGEGSAIRGEVRSHLGAVGAALGAGRTPRFVRALLATRTPLDLAASMSLRGGSRVAQPMPSEPVNEGLLRDPWRTRARFVRGRIGRLMRAVEDYVEQSIPDRIDEVGVWDGRRWRFNRALLEAALHGQPLGEETATALDGEPLDIEGLHALDANFTFDRVAARITRRRLFDVLVKLRSASRELDLDLPWGRRGDARDLLVSLLDPPAGANIVAPARESLFDGWGRPFVLRPASGRSRFQFLTPIDGWVLVSAGPDGRVGTADDMSDPFARILPSGSMYAEAVSEDVLLARISGVALGRATLRSLREVFQIPPVGHRRQEAARPHTTWGRWPGPATRRRPRAPALDRLSSSFGGVGRQVTWALPSALRSYESTALRFDADGGLALARGDFQAGAPWVAHLELPATMRPGEALRVPIELLRLAEGPVPTVEVTTTGVGVEASADGTHLSLRASGPGIAQLTVVVRAGERVVSRFEHRLRVVPDGLLRTRVHVVRAQGTTILRAPTPEGAQPWRARVTVGAPRALSADPTFAGARAASPGIFAWAQTMAGADADPDALADATRATDSLSTACAMVAWAGDEAYARRVNAAAGRVRQHAGDDLSRRASALAALASASPTAPGGTDATSLLVAELRADGWRALARPEMSAAIVARMAAGLLLADRDDARGRALLRRARRALQTDARGRRWVPGETERAGDGWIGTLALAVAARQVGEDALADELGGAALSRLYLAHRSGPEGVFWAVAASVYGVFGVDGPAQVEARVEERAETLSLDGGVAEMTVEPGSVVEITSTAPVWARLENRYLAPIESSTDGALTASVEGSAGRAGRTAGLELVVANGSDAPSGTPVLEILVPGAAALDGAARLAMQNVDGVVRVSAPDGAGVARVYLRELPAGAERRIPLPWRWIGAGRTRGLALVAYDASTPHRRFVREGQTLEIEEAP